MKFDDILDELGHFGRCSIPGLLNDSYDIQDVEQARLVNLTIPVVNASGELTYSKCQIYNISARTEGTDQQDTLHEESCLSWVYDKAIYQSTVVTKFNLVCSYKHLSSQANVLMMAGHLAGSLGLGMLSDLIGRKKTFMLSLVLQIVSGIGLAISPNFTVFSILRFTGGFTSIAMSMCMFVIGVEFVGSSRRVVSGMGIHIAWCTGLFILTALAFGIRNWQYLQIAISAPLLVFLFWWLIPESPRWLLSRGRLQDAVAIINKAAKVNKVDFTLKVFDLDTMEAKKEEKICKMFTSKTLVMRSLIIFFNWFVVGMVYYGLGLNVGRLAGNIYINFFIASIVELAAIIGCLILLERTGRKKLHCINMVISGVACITTVFPIIYGDKYLGWVTTTLAMIGKFGISSCFVIAYLFAAELFPTVVRNSGMGCSSFCARVGSMLSPYIADMGGLVSGDLSKALPLIIFGVLTVVAGLLSLFLPETLNKKLPDTIGDAERFGRNDPEKRWDTQTEATAWLKRAPTKHSIGLPSADIEL